MRITKIGGFVGGAMLMAACHTNSPKPYISPVQRAFNQASKHMTAEEIAKMKEGATRQISDFSQDVSEKIFYWDSLLNKEKVAEAYQEGRNYIKDSLNGVYYPEREFKLPLDTIIINPRHGNNIIDSNKVELGINIGGVKLYDYIQKEPKISNRPTSSVRNSKNNYSTHYYNLVGSVAEQRYAYKKGKESIRLLMNSDWH